MCSIALRHVCRALLVAIGFTFGTGCAGFEHPQRDTLNARFFPLALGDRWVYAFGEKEVTFEVISTEAKDN